MAPYLNTIGITLSLIGVLILFRYGMPFHVPTGGATYLVTDQVDEIEKSLEQRYFIYGLFGLVLVIAGAAFQLVATWI
ncbi:MAG: hypothetical protein WBA66_02830 [Xanthobacteraceae bacterium]